MTLKWGCNWMNVCPSQVTSILGASHEVPNPALLLQPVRVCVFILGGRTSVQLYQGL